MKIAADYSGKLLDIPNVFLYHLRQLLLDYREYFYTLSEVPATDSKGDIYHVRFDLFNPALDALFDLPLDNIEVFTKALYACNTFNTHFRLCEKEEEVSAEDIADNKRIYPHRKFLKLKA